MDTAQATRPLVTVEIALNKAGHLLENEQLALVESFRTNLGIILGGPERMLSTLGQRARSLNTEDGADVELDEPFRRALAAAEYATWMGVERRVGACFSFRASALRSADAP